MAYHDFTDIGEAAHADWYWRWPPVWRDWHPCGAGKALSLLSVGVAHGTTANGLTVARVDRRRDAKGGE
jgi:hypothetical protein